MAFSIHSALVGVHGAALSYAPFVPNSLCVVEIEGRRVDSGDGSPDADPVVLSRERATIFPDTITIVNPTPLRAGE